MDVERASRSCIYHRMMECQRCRLRFDRHDELGNLSGEEFLVSTKLVRLFVLTVFLISLSGAGSLVDKSRIPDGLELVAESNEKGMPEYRHTKTGIVFVLLPGGSCLIGSPDDEKDRDEDERQHPVTLDPFLIGKYEVSQREWENVMGNNPSNLEKAPDLPVHRVSSKDCQDFCEKTGLVLPTGAQWEYACRGGTTGPISGTGKLDDMGWHRENSGGKVHRCGTKQPNGFGIYDMHGNLFERCQDFYDIDFFNRPEAAGMNPECRLDTGLGERRGGDFYHPYKYARSANRGGDAIDDPEHVAGGFRPAMLLRKN